MIPMDMSTWDQQFVIVIVFPIFKIAIFIQFSFFENNENKIALGELKYTAAWNQHWGGYRTMK